MTGPILVQTSALPTMSSREIADLLEARHDNVKRTIERLAERHAIGLPPLEEYLDSLGRKATEYRVGKRDSYVIVAQLSPEFTARLVDRWQELEAAASAPAVPDFSNPAIAARAWADQFEQRHAAEQKVAVLSPRAAIVDRIEASEGSQTATRASKVLKTTRKDLFAMMERIGWIYRGPDGWLGYADTIKSGHLSHTLEPYGNATPQKTRVQLMITPKGMIRLASLLNIELQRQLPPPTTDLFQTSIPAPRGQQ